ncbi:TPA: hypothetical protein DCZ39_06470 [Patescibacteria group bacterium]|nr:hypothetical protein [Candidatus Gracilibacteria bacterium]
MNLAEIDIIGEPKNMEPKKHAQMIRAEIIDSDNSLGFAVKIEGTIIDEDHEIIHQFYDLYVYHKNIVSQTSQLQ